MTSPAGRRAARLSRPRQRQRGAARGDGRRGRPGRRTGAVSSDLVGSREIEADYDRDLYEEDPLRDRPDVALRPIQMVEVWRAVSGRPDVAAEEEQGEEQTGVSYIRNLHAHQQYRLVGRHNMRSVEEKA